MADVEQQIRRARAVVIVRGDFSWAEILQATEIMLDNEFTILEYTLTSPHALTFISRLKAKFESRMTVGAGTVVSPDNVKAAQEAGADFLVSPHWNRSLSDAAQDADSLLLPGVFTPAEVAAANQHGWNLLKLFPASIGGPNYIRALHGPYPHVDLIPTGGVDQANASAFLRAGAVAIGIGSSALKPGVSSDDLRSQLQTFRTVLDETGRN